MRNVIFGIIFTTFINQFASAEEMPLDLDCDGQGDLASEEFDEQTDTVTVTARISGTAQDHLIQFGLRDSKSLPTICSPVRRLGAAGPDLMQLTKGYGRIPEGYWVTDQCQELVLYNGECDAVHIYWNHNKQSLDWWRL